ncbi:MAG: hypothetical protein M3335_00100 [Actinomycetota bacterium]|nr:hypothetical protein [Actinomycetota bacterium]
MAIKADEIVRQAWRELPRRDRDLLKEIGADRWQVCDRALGTYVDELLHSAGNASLPTGEVARANAALGIWVPDLRLTLINESHHALEGLDDPTLAYRLSRAAWHEWGHALSFDRIGREDIAAGAHYLKLLTEGFVRTIRQGGYRRHEYTHEVVAEVYAILMAWRHQEKTGRPPWLHPEVYELARRVVR